jgi:DNA replication protein DnaC
MNDALAAKIKRLNLAGMTQTVDMRVQQAIKESLSYVEFLELLINDEHMNRGRNRRNELTRKARFPQHKTIEEFNFSWQPSLKRQEIYGFGTCEFIRKRENIAFIGLPGTGKTHLSIAVGGKAIEQGYSVMFATLSDMMEELYFSRADNSFRQKLKKYTQPDLLIIDEFGLKKLNQTSVDDLYEVISKRYEINSTIITSNKEFSEWGGILFDPVLASAILDRFVHHCNFVTIDGDSYRMKERIGSAGTGRRGRPRKNTPPSSGEGSGTEDDAGGQNMEGDEFK